MPKTTEMKCLPVFIKEISGRLVTGFASIFGVLDSYDDIVQPGAFAKTLVEQDGRVKHFWQHQYWMPPTAAIRELREVGRDELPEAVLAKYPESTGGLLVKREYLDTPRGNEILSGIESGAINEMSFMFNVINAQFVEKTIVERGKVSIRYLLELRLWETSDVTWGANAATVASKSDHGPMGVRVGYLTQEVEYHLSLMKKKSSRDPYAARLSTALEALKDALSAMPDSNDEHHVDTLRLKMQAAALRSRALELQN
jgi:HK97 family phage prohead protease